MVDPIDILLVGRDDGRLEKMADRLSDAHEKMSARLATGCESALGELEDHSIDCILGEYDLDGTNGVAVIESIRKEHPEIPFILYTDSGPATLAHKALDIGITDVVWKSTSEDTQVLAKRIEDVLGAGRPGPQSELGEIGRQILAVNEALVESTERDTIEQRICDILCRSQMCSIAWFGVIDTEARCIRGRAAAGEGLIPDPEWTIEMNAGTYSGGATVKAIEAESVTVDRSPDVTTVPDGLAPIEIRVTAAVPIVFEDTIYGVLTIYSDTPGAFDEEIQLLFADLGADIAQAFRRIERETRYRSLFETSLNGIAVHEIVTDEAGNPIDYVFLDVNPAFEELTGLQVADVRGERATEVLSNLEREFIEKYGQVALEKESIRFEQYSTPLGKHFDISAFPLPDNRFVTVFRDVTQDRDRAEEIQRFAEFRRVLSEVDEVLLRAGQTQTMLSEVTAIISGSDLFECTFIMLDGRSTIEVVCESESELDESEVEAFHTDDYLETVFERGSLRIEDVTEPPFVQHVEKRPSHKGMAFGISHQEQEYGVMTVHFAPGQDISDDAVSLLQQLVDDIALFLHNQELDRRRRKREREARESREAYKDLFHGIRDAVFVHEDGNEFVAVNEAACDRLGYDEAELLELTRSDVVAEEQRELVEQRIETVDRDGTSTFEMVHVSKSGERIPVEITLSRIEYFGEEAILSVARDITERKQREQRLEKRERLFHQCHLTTQDFLTAETESEVFEQLVEDMATALDYSFYAAIRFDGEAGQFQTMAVSSSLPGVFPELPGIEPGENPIWEAYRAGETSICEQLESPTLPADVLDPLTEVLVVPIGKFGLVLVGISDEGSLDDVDVELMELLSTSAEGILGRIHRQRQLGEVSAELSTQQNRIHELEGLMDAIEAIQQRIAASETRNALESAVCEELVDTERIDFVWIGRPETAEIELSPTAWAGSERGYLDMIDMDEEIPHLPSQQAASHRHLVTISSISERVYEESWATEALSREWQSVISIPLVHDDVLYGVLTAFSRVEAAFDDLYETLLADVGSILVNYLSILNMRYAESHAKFVEVDFEVSDPAYPLYSLARETGTKIRFDTIAETTEAVVKILVTVLDGDAKRVFDHATNITKIQGVDWFGDPENRQLTLEVGKPFLATEVTKHGGRLLDSIADEDTAIIRISLPETVSVRPVVEWLTTQYRDIDLIARKESTRTNVRDITRPKEFLTDRQFEMLRAAYHGGYYETPKGVTGEDLADSFDISSSVVYNHLQAAHRTLLGKIFDSEIDNKDKDI